jgi:hypothetical protein
MQVKNSLDFLTIFSGKKISARNQHFILSKHPGLCYNLTMKSKAGISIWLNNNANPLRRAADLHFRGC